MIIRKLSQTIGTDQEVVTPNWTSRRLLLQKDGMGFSFHETTIRAGSETYIWYKHHLEAVYCVSGEGEVETLADGKIHSIRPGTLYALNENDKHFLRAFTDMKLICVFNPALTGREVHDKEGIYPLLVEKN